MPTEFPVFTVREITHCPRRMCDRILVAESSVELVQWNGWRFSGRISSTDAMGTEFGGRHALYERNYFGNQENIGTEVVLAAEHMERRASTRVLPNNAWPSTISTAGRCRI